MSPSRSKKLVTSHWVSVVQINDAFEVYGTIQRRGLFKDMALFPSGTVCVAAHLAVRVGISIAWEGPWWLLNLVASSSSSSSSPPPLPILHAGLQLK